MLRIWDDIVPAVSYDTKTGGRKRFGTDSMSDR